MGRKIVRKRRVIASIFAMMLGLFALANSWSNPRLAAIHGSDIAQLIAAGFCFGAAFGLLIGARRFPGEEGAAEPPQR
jgi:hypothetical protein